jgi:hypothetical protein
VTIGVDGLRALARKYRSLVELRARRDGGAAAAAGEAPAMGVLRELAREFPGCLRELDTLGAAELARRAAAAEGAAGEASSVEDWMLWIWGYHRLMRAALAIRRGTAAEVSGQVSGQVSGVEGDDLVDAGFVAEVRAPPGGRIGIVVLRRLEALHGRPAREIAARLFPPRRPSPYEL